MTEIVQYQTNAPSPLLDQMEYARAVSVASMLPDNYRGKPADIMLAVGLGQSMGLSPAESLYRIAVIKGKPTASAELIASNVRKAGHRLRTVIAPDGKSATASIWRADDPDFEHSVTRDLAWAQSMGLSTQDNYRKQLPTMLANRAITAVARLACPEALYGVAYAPDEMSESDGPRMTVVQESPADRMRAALHPQSSGAEEAPAPGQAVEPETPSAPESPIADLRSGLARKAFALAAEAGYADDIACRDEFSRIIGRQLTSRKELTDADLQQIVDDLQARVEQPFPDGADS